MSEPIARRTILAAAGFAAPAVMGAGATAAQPLTARMIEAEMQRRAAWHRAQDRLAVDYYRISTMLSYPLPVRGLSKPEMVVPTIPDYPWSIWMLWALEERLLSLGWAAEWFRDGATTALAASGLEALADFPAFCELDKPDLAAGHAARVLWTAGRRWTWVGADLRARIRSACARHVEEVLPRFRNHYGPIRSAQDLLSAPPPYAKLHNIALIGTIGAALAASLIGHPEAGELNRAIRLIFEAILDFRPGGYTEGVAYDGYILDFIADWLEILPAPERDALLHHPRMGDFLDQSYQLSAPGAPEQVAELGDVEPERMPFHFSAQAKLARWQPTPVRSWYLRSWRPGRMRADALAALRPAADRLVGTEPAARPSHPGYAAVLRSGWAAGDLAVAMSLTNSPTGHLPCDNGTIVIAKGGDWILADPGYQQYMEGSEREFTIGPAAHNYPLLNGAVQNAKKPRLLRLDAASGLARASVDLTDCYPADPGTGAAGRTVKRHLWLQGRSAVVVADEFGGGALDNVTYHWHGHAGAEWWSQAGWLLLHRDGVRLWFRSPALRLTLRDVARLPGSRGQLTATARLAPAPPVVWWVFAASETPPDIDMDGIGRRFTVGPQRFEL